MTKSNYEVGYKKPPEHSRYPQGVSGNPQGRPKNKKPSKNIITMLSEEMDKEYQFNHGDGTKSMRAKRAIARQAVQGAMKGGKDAELFIKLILNSKKLVYF